MVVCSIQSERHLFVYAAALGTVFILPADHGTLQGNNRHPALVARRIAAVGIESPHRFSLIKSAVGIIRLHGIAVFGTYPINNCHAALIGIGSVAARVNRPRRFRFIAVLAGILRSLGSKTHIIAFGGFHNKRNVPTTRTHA